MQSDCDEARLLWFMTLSTHSIGNDHEIDEHRKKICCNSNYAYKWCALRWKLEIRVNDSTKKNEKNKKSKIKLTHILVVSICLTTPGNMLIKTLYAIEIIEKLNKLTQLGPTGLCVKLKVVQWCSWDETFQLKHF